MVIYSTTQYTMSCDKCGEPAQVLNQGDPNVWTLKDAMAYWRMHNWTISKKHKCPKCSPNPNNQNPQTSSKSPKTFEPVITTGDTLRGSSKASNKSEDMRGKSNG